MRCGREEHYNYPIISSGLYSTGNLQLICTLSPNKTQTVQRRRDSPDIGPGIPRLDLPSIGTQNVPTFLTN